MELKFLGRGSAFNVKEGNTSAYIKQDGVLLLIDCGESTFQRIIENNLLDEIKEVYVLITHFHSDHIGSLSSLIMYCFYCKGIKPNVYYPKKDNMECFLNSTGAYHNDLWNTMNKDDLEEKLGLIISPRRVSHVSEVATYGYHLEDNYTGEIIAYTGDTNSKWSDFIELKYHTWNHTIMYQDTCLADYEGNVHTSLRELCEIVPKEYRNKVYCMHLDCDELIEKAKAEGFNVVEVE